MSRSLTVPQQLAALAGFIAVTFCAPLASISIMPPGPWYDTLHKPTFNPPAWLFGPVWILLYTLMAVAAWLIWKRSGWRLPLVLYFIQLALNALWTPLFFGAHQLGPALLEIGLLWVAILLTTLQFLRFSKAAAWLMTPYLAWVGFASFLNFTLWSLN